MTADVRVADGRFAEVRVPGFDASPLIGSPADLPLGAVAARVRAAVPFGVEPVGATISEIAAAVRAAAGTPENPDRIGAYTVADVDRLTADWRGFGWRILPETPLPAAESVAFDEVLVESVAAGGAPVLRFWGWTGPAVVVGRSQSVPDEVDPAAGVTVVRRVSGGGAMVVRPGGVVTYSLAMPEAAVAGLSIRQSYELCDAWAVLALRGLGLEAWYVPVNDIACGLGKIAGAAQARRRGVVLHHATVAVDLDPADVARVLRLDQPRPTGGVASARKVVAPLSLQAAVRRTAVLDALRQEFRSRYGGSDSEPTAAELDAAAALALDKYTTDEWTKPRG